MQGDLLPYNESSSEHETTVPRGPDQMTDVSNVVATFDASSVLAAEVEEGDKSRIDDNSFEEELCEWLQERRRRRRESSQLDEPQHALLHLGSSLHTDEAPIPVSQLAASFGAMDDVVETIKTSSNETPTVLESSSPAQFEFTDFCEDTKRSAARKQKQGPNLRQPECLAIPEFESVNASLPSSVDINLPPSIELSSASDAATAGSIQAQSAATTALRPSPRLANQTNSGSGPANPLFADSANAPPPFFEVQATVVDTELYVGTLIPDDGGPSTLTNPPSQRSSLLHGWSKKYFLCALVSSVLIAGGLAGVVATLLISRGGEDNAKNDPGSISTTANKDSEIDDKANSDPGSSGTIGITSLSPTENATEDISGHDSIATTDVPTVINQEVTTSSPSMCLRATTSELYIANGGTVNIFVDSGMGYNLVSTGGKVYGLGETVVDQCFDDIIGVQVSNDCLDAWVGYVEVSADGGLTYIPMTCADCMGNTTDMPIVVDLNWDSGDQATTQCIDGSNCTLITPSWNQKGAVFNGKADGDRFGGAIAVSDNADILAIGAMNSDDGAGGNNGQVTIYEWDEGSTSYTQIGKPIEGSEMHGYFGSSLSLSSSGSILAVGASTCGDRSDSCESRALSDDCTSDPAYMIVNCTKSCRLCGLGADEVLWTTDSTVSTSSLNWDGYVKVYKLQQLGDDLSWQQFGSTLSGAPNDLFGFSVQLSGDSTTLAVSAPGGPDIAQGFVKVYKYDESLMDYSELGDAIYGGEGDFWGHSLALSGDGKTLIISAPWNKRQIGCTDCGDYGYVKAFRFDEQNSEWNDLGQELIGDFYFNDFGWDVSLSQDGNILAISVRTVGGIVRIYEFSDNLSWEQRGSDIVGLMPGDRLGKSISLSFDGSVIAVGSKYNAVNKDNAGQTRVYRWNKNLKEYVQHGFPINGEKAGDQFGVSVALSSSGTLAVGAQFAEGTGQVKVYMMFDNTTLF